MTVHSLLRDVLSSETWLSAIAEKNLITVGRWEDTIWKCHASEKPILVPSPGTHQTTSSLGKPSRGQLWRSAVLWSSHCWWSPQHIAWNQPSYGDIDIPPVTSRKTEKRHRTTLLIATYQAWAKEGYGENNVTKHWKIRRQDKSDIAHVIKLRRP